MTQEQEPLAEELSTEPRGEPTGADPDGMVDVASDETERQPKISEGDIVRDKDPVPWLKEKDLNEFIVKEVTEIPQDEYQSHHLPADCTLREDRSKNKNYPEDSPAVILEMVHNGRITLHPLARLERI